MAGDTIYVATWSPFGEADQRGTLPDFETLLKSNKDGNGTINRDEVPASVNIFSRPETPDVPGATYSVKAAFARFDANKDGELQKEEWEVGQKVVSSLKIEHGLLAVKLGGSGTSRPHTSSGRKRRRFPKYIATRLSEQGLHGQERWHPDVHGGGYRQGSV